MVPSSIYDWSTSFCIEVLTFYIPSTLFFDVVVTETNACSPSSGVVNMGVFQPFAAYPNFVEVSVSVETVDVFVTIRAILVYTIVETTNCSVFT